MVAIVQTREEAGQKVIPFGKYQGLTLEVVSGIPGGGQFLLELLKNRSVSSHLKTAIQVFLQPNLDFTGAEIRIAEMMQNDLQTN